jgi:hypothetical protein
MTEDIYKILESSGWVRELIDDNWTGYYSKTIQSPGNTMVINGRRMDSPPEITKLEIEYKGDGWVENADGSEHQNTTQWDLRFIKGELSKEITIIVYSPDQFVEIIKELGL